MSFSSWLKTWFWQILVFVTVTVLTVIPMPEKINSVHNLDKLGHILYLGLISTILVRRIRPWNVIVVGISASVGIEVVQYFLPWRECSILDALCGSIGTIVAVFMYEKVKCYRDALEFKLW